MLSQTKEDVRPRINQPSLIEKTILIGIPFATRTELSPHCLQHGLQNVPLKWAFRLSPLSLPTPSLLFPEMNSQRIYLHQAFDSGSTFRESQPKTIIKKIY